MPNIYKQYKFLGRKSFLIIKKNSETIDSLNRKFISKELVDLAKNGNRVWFSSNIELLGLFIISSVSSDIFIL